MSDFTDAQLEAVMLELATNSACPHNTSCACDLEAGARKILQIQLERDAIQQHIDVVTEKRDVALQRMRVLEGQIYEAKLRNIELEMLLKATLKDK